MTAILVALLAFIHCIAALAWELRLPPPSEHESEPERESAPEAAQHNGRPYVVRHHDSTGHTLH